MCAKEYKHVYIELLKITSQVENNAVSLKDCFWAWGNHDFIKVKIHNEESTNAILWFKQTYELSHSKCYDGVEHQPLFLTSSDPISEGSPIYNLYEGKTEHIFVLTRFQIDYGCTTNIMGLGKAINEIEQEALLQTIKKEIITHYNDTVKPISEQVFLDWGEADIAILFETDNVQCVSDIIMNIRSHLPVVRSYSLIVFPYTYMWLNDNWKKKEKLAEIQRNISRWFVGEDNKTLDILTHYMTDTLHQGIFKGRTTDPKLIFGDYDVQIISAAETFTEKPYNPVNPSELYRYSKTTPLLPINNMGNPFCEKAEVECSAYVNLIEDLSESFNKVIDKIENIFMENQLMSRTLTDNFKSAKYTLINLANYFTRLHETKHTPDVYVHLKSIFIELSFALNELTQYCEILDDKSDELEDEKKDNIIKDIFLGFDVDIKVLMSKMQQFLGIVSLSPRAFSEAHGSYMRSANAALKLVCAYHAAVYFMHQATKQRIDGNDVGKDPTDYVDEERIEHENCAVLILPSRDAETINTTLFTSITPTHHMCVIEANFNSLFKVQEMLFLLAHEVGHFSGNRMRSIRQPLVINAAVRHMLFRGIFIEPLNNPYKMLMGDIDLTEEETKLLKNLDTELDRKNIKMVQVINNINILSELIAKGFNKYLESVQVSLPAKIYNLPLKFQYMMPCIDTAYDVFDQQYDDILKMESVKSSLKGVVEKLLEWFHHILKDVYSKKDISARLKRVAGARVMYETSLGDKYDYIVQKYENHLKELKTAEPFYYHMYWISTLFSDVFSDIYAIKLLGVEIKDYIKYIFNNRLDLDSYKDPLFLSRVIIVLQTVYRISEAEIKTTLEEVIPTNWKIDIITNIQYVLDFQEIYLKDGSVYAKRISEELMFTEDTSGYNEILLLRKLYNDPENNLYAIWRKGLTRGETANVRSE